MPNQNDAKKLANDWIREKAEAVAADFVTSDGSEGGLYLADVIETVMREAEARGRSAGMEKAAQMCSESYGSIREYNAVGDRMAAIIRAAKDSNNE